MDNAQKLIDLARERFGDLTCAEVGMLLAAATAGNADCRTGEPNKDDPANADEWVKDRTIRANRIMWLCTDRDAMPLVSHRGIQVTGARVDGSVQLDFASIPFPLEFSECKIGEPIQLRHSRIPALLLNGTHIKALIADGIDVSGGVFLREGFQAESEVCLTGARIGGNLSCVNGRLKNANGMALTADGIHVEGGVFLRDGFQADGQVRLPGARVGGDLDCSGGGFKNAREPALVANGMKVEGSVLFRNGFEAHGEVRLLCARIGNSLECDKGRFMNPRGVALLADGIDVGGAVFLREGFQAEGEVRLPGASIARDLDCSKALFSVHAVPGDDRRAALQLQSAVVGGSVSCRGGRFTNAKGSALSANGVSVRDSICLDHGFEAEGEVQLLAAEVGGKLSCVKGRFRNANGKAVSADGIDVTGSVLLRDGFEAYGQVRLLGAKIGGALDCLGGRFKNANGEALSADGITVSGSVFLREGFEAEGQVRLVGATIGGNLECDKGRFRNGDARSLLAHGVRITGNVFVRDGFEAEGGVSFVGASVRGFFQWKGLESPQKTALNLQSADVGVLDDDAASWPAKGYLRLDALRYEHLSDDSPKDARSRIEWLRRQPEDQFRPQPYEQLAAVLRSAGHEEDAKQVLIEKNRDYVKYRRGYGPKLSWAEWFWYRVFGPMVRFGYRPAHALRHILAIIGFGAIVFGLAHSSGCMRATSDERSCAPFNALVYSADVFVPIVDLRQASAFVPDASAGPALIEHRLLVWRWSGLVCAYMYFHIIAGWALSTLFVVGLTGRIKT